MPRKSAVFVRKFGRCERGQTLAETAITIMTFLIVVLGIIQLSLIVNAKFMTNYAAYCAARAGILYNGDQGKMEHAAAVALAPCSRTACPDLCSATARRAFYREWKFFHPVRTDSHPITKADSSRPWIMFSGMRPIWTTTCFG